MMVARQINAWRRAWASDLIDTVEEYAPGHYTVPSQTTPDEVYVVVRYRLRPNGYLYLCTCNASEKGGVCCAHMWAVYLWRLERKMGWATKSPLLPGCRRHATRRSASTTS